jgi:hypothetical protein
LSATQIKGLEVADLKQLSTTVIAGLTTTQVASLTVDQVCNLTTTQLGSLTTTQIASLPLVTPIVLDLNGDGINTLSVKAGVKFDILANGSPTQTGWVAPQDGLLVADRNQDGVINDGSELFGSSTLLNDGTKALDGYQALSQFDSNSDGVVNQQDTDFSKLSVWTDSNSDGATETGELKSLAELGITQLSVQAEEVRESNAGNLVGLKSTYQTADGNQHASADVWFVVDKDSKELLSNHLASAISEFKDSTFGGNSLNLDRSELQRSSLQSSSVSVNSNRLTKALKDYQLSTASSALNVIHTIGQKGEDSLFAPPLGGVTELEKLNSQNPDVFSLTNKSK